MRARQGVHDHQPIPIVIFLPLLARAACNLWSFFFSLHFFFFFFLVPAPGCCLLLAGGLVVEDVSSNVAAGVLWLALREQEEARLFEAWVAKIRRNRKRKKEEKKKGKANILEKNAKGKGKHATYD